MTMTFERKRDAAFKLLASFGFEWDGKAWAPSGENTSGWVSAEEHQSALAVGDAMSEFIAASVADHSCPGALVEYRQRLMMAAEQALTTDPVLVAARNDPALQAAEAERIRAFQEVADPATVERLPDELVAVEISLLEAWDIQTNCYGRHRKASQPTS